MTRSVDRLLAGLLMVLLLCAAIGAVPGLMAITSDLEAEGEFLDGLGIMIGLGVLVLVAVPATMAVLALRALRRGRPSARRWIIATGIVTFVAVLPFGMFSHPLLALLGLPMLLTAVAATAGPES